MLLNGEGTKIISPSFVLGSDPGNKLSLPPGLSLERYKVMKGVQGLGTHFRTIGGVAGDVFLIMGFWGGFFIIEERGDLLNKSVLIIHFLVE